MNSLINEENLAWARSVAKTAYPIEEIFNGCWVIGFKREPYLFICGKPDQDPDVTQMLILMELAKSHARQAAEQAHRFLMTQSIGGAQ